VVSGVTAEIVDRFLAARRTPVIGRPASVSTESCPSCSGGAIGRPAPVEQQTAAGGPIEPPAPEVAIVDFVCENDVRAAVQASRKIYIGPKTIVTPAARELADRHDILVLAQR
jgi:hypothetical protein